jgi:hypothetical protein
MLNLVDDANLRYEYMIFGPLVVCQGHDRERTAAIFLYVSDFPSSQDKVPDVLGQLLVLPPSFLIY